MRVFRKSIGVKYPHSSHREARFPTYRRAGTLQIFFLLPLKGAETDGRLHFVRHSRKPPVGHQVDLGKYFNLIYCLYGADGFCISLAV